MQWERNCVTPDVVNSGQAAFYNNVLDGGKRAPGDFLRWPHRPLQGLPVRGTAGSWPDPNAAGQFMLSIVPARSMVLVLRHSQESSHWECAMALQKAYSHHWPGIITTDNWTSSASFYSPALHLLQPIQTWNCQREEHHREGDEAATQQWIQIEMELKRLKTQQRILNMILTMCDVIVIENHYFTWVA